MANEFLLAAGPGEILPVIFVVIAIISGIVNHIKEKNAAAARMANRGGGRNPREANLQGEIESFLNEVSASDRPDEENRRRQRPPNRQGQQQRRKKASRPREDAPAKRPPRENRRESVASRQLDKGDIGHMRERHVESAVEQRHLESKVAESHFEDDEYGAAPAGIVGGKQNVSAAGIELFQQAGGIRSVIVMNEILSKPISRRRNDR